MKSASSIEMPSCPSISSFTGDQIDALRTAERIYAEYPGWWKVVPDCPCDETRISRDWSGEPAKQEFHPGAARCYRSPPARVEDVRAAGLDPSKLLPGQQCCYDGEKKLITGGAAAGTPDAHAPIDEKSFAAHEAEDVEPFRKLGWKIYNMYWPPNNGDNCPRNKKPV
jgi:hypothetical protein